ncbi:DUF192 domain-containing protein [Candidatus Woesearchaeota archaeon]|nr:DUF192 domain-containing protein [Candidatus Woesearchaeota archaeon]
MLKNLTKKNTIVKNIKLCKSLFSKFKGLMFSERLKDSCLIFVFNKPVRTDLHMFFVFYAIDVLFLNEDKKVIEIKENFRPFAVYLPEKKSKYIIELPKNTVKKKNIKIKDKLSFTDF